jgi:aspartate/methionine/tyrosine aminotransferase
MVALFCMVQCAALNVPSKQSVWKVFGDLAVQYKACNLGQGFPDWNTPPFVLQSLQRTVQHQYTIPAGYPKLTELIAQRYSTHLDKDLVGAKNVAITVGASQALYLALQSLLRAGDEIIMFDPFFELYAKQIALTAAKPVFVPLGNVGQSSDPWALNIDALRKYATNPLRM